jgi:hypothetical protein
VPEREYDDYAAAFIGSADGAKPAFPLRMERVGEDGEWARKKAFNDLNGKPMFLALGSISPVPFEAVRL